MLSKPFLTSLATLLLAASAGSASAHAHLTGATPAPNATVRGSPLAVRIVFSEPVVAGFSGMELIDPKGGKVDLGKASVSPTDKHLLSAPLRAPLAAGSYTVRWHAVSADTHRVSGQYAFKVAP